MFFSIQCIVFNVGVIVYHFVALYKNKIKEDNYAQVIVPPVVMGCVIFMSFLMILDGCCGWVRRRVNTASQGSGEEGITKNNKSQEAYDKLDTL